MRLFAKTRPSLFLDQILQDTKFALRVLCKDRLFTIVAVLTFALGIGANTAMFSVLNSVLLKPLPGYETNRLLRITDNDIRFRAGFLPPNLYLQLLTHTSSFDTLAAQQFCPFNLIGVGEPEQLTATCTSANWFALQHSRAFLGRTFAPDEDQRGKSRVVLLSYAFWRKKFNGNPRAIGRVISLNGAPWTVIGIMPAGFHPLNVSDAPLFTPNVIPDNPAGLIVTARLKPSTTISQAAAELNTLAARLVRSQPSLWKGTSFTLTPVLDELTGAQKPLLLLLMGAVCFILLIACTNVANLLLARAQKRQHEMSIRLALGASPTRILRFLLTEVLLLCSTASLLAVAIAWSGIRLLRPLLATLPRAGEISIDSQVFLWALFLGWIATLLAGLLPALRSARLHRAAGMYARATFKSQTVLLAFEVALALVLFVGAGLLIRTFFNLRTAKLGYDSANTLTGFLSLPEQSNTQSAELTYRRIRDRLEKIPGVQSVATATSTPAGGADMSVEVEPEGTAAKNGTPIATVNLVSPQYFRTLHIALTQGRSFLNTDRVGAPPVAIVSDSIAHRYFHNRAVGRRLHIPSINFALTDAKMIWAEIVGVAANVSVSSPGQTNAEHLYLPEEQTPVRLTYILLRTNTNPLSYAPTLRHIVYAESPTTPLDEVKSMDERSAYLTAGTQHAMWLLALFAALAGMLAAVGIYAVSSYLVSQRRRDVAIRIALGATRLSLARTLWKKPALAIVTGILCGITASCALTRLLASLLFEVKSLDLKTYAAAAALLAACAFAALLHPARRITRLDVAQTLRQD